MAYERKYTDEQVRQATEILWDLGASFHWQGYRDLSQKDLLWIAGHGTEAWDDEMERAREQRAASWEL